MLQAILLVILIFVCVALVAVILLQKSEGGALGMGGGPSGFMSTRGVGDLLSRTTGILAASFFILCLALTLIIGRAHKGDAVVDRLKIQGLDPASLARPTAPAPANTATPAGPAPGAPILEAPKPEVHTAPAAAPLVSAAPVVAKRAASPAAKSPTPTVTKPAIAAPTVSAPSAAPSPAPAAPAPAATNTTAPSKP